MSRPKANKSSQPKDVTPFWVERGFRAEIAASRAKPGDDPKGEEAYQRAFYEAAQAQPPRLPNPSHYPNSPSAREFMQKRNIETSSRRAPGKRPGEDDLGFSRSTRQLRDPDRSPSIPSKESLSASPGSNYSTSSKPPPPSTLALPRTEDFRLGQMSSLPPLPPSTGSTQSAARFMEPLGAPSGPVNRPWG